jgi:hypothetical protein
MAERFGGGKPVSQSYRKTVAALAFSEAAANVILETDEPDDTWDPDVVESAKAIKCYCDEAYHSLGRALVQKDIAKFLKAAEKTGVAWRPESVETAQTMISWCAFLIDEPLQKTKNPGLKECLQSIADLLMHIHGYIEERDGGPVWDAIAEAENAYRIWGDTGWIN